MDPLRYWKGEGVRTNGRLGVTIRHGRSVKERARNLLTVGSATAIIKEVSLTWSDVGGA